MDLLPAEMEPMSDFACSTMFRGGGVCFYLRCIHSCSVMEYHIAMN